MARVLVYTEHKNRLAGVGHDSLTRAGIHFCFQNLIQNTDVCSPCILGCSTYFAARGDVCWGQLCKLRQMLKHICPAMQLAPEVL